MSRLSSHPTALIERPDAAREIDWIPLQDISAARPDDEPTAMQPSAALAATEPEQWSPLRVTGGIALVVCGLIGVLQLTTAFTSTKVQEATPVAADTAEQLADSGPADDAAPEVVAPQPAPAEPVVPAVTIVATRHDGGDPFRVVVDETAHLSFRGAFGDKRDFAVDASGQWLAAASTSETNHRDQDLWLGPVTGNLEPIVSGVRGFAWHDTEPGRLAWTHRESPTADLHLFTRDLREPATAAADLGPVTGWLRSWGDWGWSLTNSSASSWFDVLDADRNVVVEGARGSLAGHVPGLGLVMSPWGARSQPEYLDLDQPEDGFLPVPWLAGGHHLWSMAVSPEGLVAAQVTNFDTRQHELIIVDRQGVVLGSTPAAGSTGALAWSADGQSLVYIREDWRREYRTELVAFNTRAATFTVATLPFMDPADHWSRVVAHQSPEPG